MAVLVLCASSHSQARLLAAATRRVVRVRPRDPATKLTQAFLYMVACTTRAAQHGPRGPHLLPRGQPLHETVANLLAHAARQARQRRGLWGCGQDRRGARSQSGADSGAALPNKTMRAGFCSKAPRARNEFDVTIRAGERHICCCDSHRNRNLTLLLRLLPAWASCPVRPSRHRPCCCRCWRPRFRSRWPHRPPGWSASAPGAASRRGGARPGWRRPG